MSDHDTIIAAVDAAALAAGGVAKLAAEAGVSSTAPVMWKARLSIPVEYCATIERLSGTRRWHLRPKDWHRIWPELIGAEGAPVVEAA